MLNSTQSLREGLTRERRESVKRFETACKGMSEPGSEIRPQNYQGWLTRVTAILADSRRTYVWVEGRKVSIHHHNIPDVFDPKYVMHSVSILDHNKAKGSYSFVLGLRNATGNGSETVMTFRVKNEEEFMNWFSVLYSNCFAVMNNAALLDKADDCGRLLDRIGEARPLELTVGMARFIRQKFPRGVEEINCFIAEMDEQDKSKSLSTRFSRDPPELKERKKWARLLRYFLKIGTLRLTSGAADCGAVEAVLNLDLTIFPSVTTLSLRYVEIDNVDGGSIVESLQIDSCVGAIHWYVNTRNLYIRQCEGLHFGGIYFMSHSLESMRINSFIQDSDLAEALRVPGEHSPLRKASRTAFVTASATASLTHAIPLSQRWVNLHTLDLSHNLLKVLPEEFQQLRRLKTLVLDFNELQSLEMLRPLRNLVMLSVRSNNIGCTRPLTELRNLTSLNLASNQVPEIDFDTLTNLVTVDLSNNSLTDWRDIFALSLSASNLEVIHLDGNPLKRMIAKQDYGPVIRSMFSRSITLDGRRVSKADRELLEEMLERYQDRVFTLKRRKSGSQAPRELGSDDGSTSHTSVSSKGRRRVVRRVRRKKKRAAVDPETAQLPEDTPRERRESTPLLGHSPSHAPPNYGHRQSPIGITQTGLHGVASSSPRDILDQWQASLPEKSAQDEAIADPQEHISQETLNTISRRSSAEVLRPATMDHDSPVHSAIQPIRRRSTSSRLPEGGSHQSGRDVDAMEVIYVEPVQDLNATVESAVSSSAPPLLEPNHKLVKPRKHPAVSPPPCPPRSPRLSGNHSSRPRSQSAVSVASVSQAASKSRASSMHRSVSLGHDVAATAKDPVPVEGVNTSDADMWAGLKRQMREQQQQQQQRREEEEASGAVHATQIQHQRKPGGAARRVTGSGEYAVLDDSHSEAVTAATGLTGEEHDYIPVIITQEMRDLAVKVAQPAKGAYKFLSSGPLYLAGWYKKYWRSLDKREYATLQKILVVVCHIHLALVIPFAIVFAQLPCNNCTAEDEYNEQRFRYFISVMIMTGSAFQTILGIYALFYENIVMLVFFNLLTVVLAVRYMYNMFNYLEDHAVVFSVIGPPIIEIIYELFYLGVSLLIWPNFNRLVFYRVGGGPHLVKMYKKLQIFAALARTDLLFIVLSAIIASFWYIHETWQWVLMSLTCVAAVALYHFAVNWTIREQRRELIFFVLLVLGLFGVQVYMIWTLSIEPDSELRARLHTAFHATVYTIIAALTIKVFMFISLGICVLSFGKGLKEALEGEVGDERIWGVPTAQV